MTRLPSEKDLHQIVTTLQENKADYQDNHNYNIGLGKKKQGAETRKVKGKYGTDLSEIYRLKDENGEQHNNSVRGASGVVNVTNEGEVLARSAIQHNNYYNYLLQNVEPKTPGSGELKTKKSVPHARRQ